MRILFICGSIEPGRDGVGDYTRKLAAEFIKLGHEGSIVALNDKFLTKGFVQKHDDQHGSSLHISSEVPWEDRIEVVNSFIQSFNPHWVSLQYVPYSFHNKGLPFKLVSILKLINRNYLWHIMFHEIWVGIKRKSPFTHNFYKFFQERIAKKLVRELNLSYISTSNRIYQLELGRVGIRANILTLFSNISLLPIDRYFISCVYKRMNIRQEQLDKYLVMGIFGNVNISSFLISLLDNEIAMAERDNKETKLIVFGRVGNNNELKNLQKVFNSKMDIVHIGELSEVHISSILQILDKGVSVTPEEYISKSGVYAAMKLHNTPVLSVSSMFIPEYEAEIKVFNLYLKERESFKWNVKYVANELYENLCVYTHL